MPTVPFGTQFSVNAQVPAFSAKGKPLPESSLKFEWSAQHVNPDRPAFTFEQDATDPSIIRGQIVEEPTEPEINDLQGTITLNVRNQSDVLLGSGGLPLGGSIQAATIGDIDLQLTTGETP